MRTRTSFTLVELLVVVAIVSILFAMLFPVLAKTIETARSAACANNEKQIYFATTIYSDNWDCVHPPDYHYAGTVYASPLNEYGYASWTNVLVYFNLLTRKSEYCPAKDSYIGAAARAYSGYNGDYGLNDYVFTDRWMKFEKLLAPSKLYMYGEKEKVWSAPYNRWCPATGSKFNTDALTCDESAHSDGLNVAFADGHVSRVNGAVASIKNYQYLPWYNVTQEKK